MTDVGGLFRRALRINQHGQIAGNAGRIHVVEEIRSMAAEQILHIVLGRSDDNVDAGFVHQPVETAVIKWDGETAGPLRVDVHGRYSGFRRRV